MDICGERKRKLKEQYRLMKPDMGVFVVICGGNSRHYVEASSDLRGGMNRTVFQLNAGLRPNREL